MLSDAQPTVASQTGTSAGARRRGRLAGAQAGAAIDPTRQSWERRIDALIAHGSDLVVVLDADDAVNWQSPAVERLLGYSADELTGANAMSLVHPDDVEAVRLAYADTQHAPGLPATAIFRCRHANGTWRYLEATIVNLLSDPAVRGVVVNGRDVTDRIEAQEDRLRTEIKFRTLVEQAPAVIYTTAPDDITAILWVSPRCEAMCGYSPRELVAEPGLWSRLIHADDAARVADESYTATLAGEPFRSEYRVRTRDGRAVWVRDEALLVRDELGSPLYWQGLQIDISSQRWMQDELLRLAFQDDLTGLPNRALFRDRLEHALARHERGGDMAAVAIVDLDNFRMINDSLGREASDVLLRHASERMQHVLRAGDTIARIAGDQFAILFERISGIDEAYQITERMLEAFATPFILAGRELTVTAGAGIVVNGPGYRSPEDLLRNAALALRRAKAGGTGRINVFHQGMHAVALHRLEREIALRAAIERQEIALAWQPTVSLRDQRVTGMEALARWRMPNGSIVTPSEFIPLAEETGLIVPLGRWILREACRQVSAWRAMAPGQPPVEVSVNLSARQLHQHSIVEDILTVLRETAADPHQIVLELTESAVMADVPVAAAVLAELRAAGLRFAIDDFGTGHSALSYLRDFPFDYLKIDRSFIAGLDGVGGDRVLVSSVIGLARGLGLTTIAEGVETARQAATLRSLGCDVAQGNYFSFPLSADEMTILLARRDALVLAAGD